MNITDLQQQAITIRDEDNRSANTATRVGRAILDTVNALAENATAVATNKANIATNTTDLANIKAFYRGDLGNHATWTEATARLDLMPTDGSVNGQYQISVGAIPFIVNFALLNNSDKIFTQSVIGSATINSDGTLSTSHGIAVNIFSRTYTNATWSNWTRLANLGDVPKAQEGLDGYKEVYVYSHKSDPNRQVLSANFKAIINNQRKVELQHRIWGATDYTSDTTKYIVFPTVNASQQGVMDNYVYARVLNHTIQESGSTTTGVVIHYTNFAASGDRTFTITAASSAKAGVMTTAQYNQLTNLADFYKGKLGSFSSTPDFNTALDGMSITHIGTYGRFMADVNNVKVFITFVRLSAYSYAQWVEGPVIKNNGQIFLNNELGAHLIGRVYANGAWGEWRSTILDDELPINASATADGLMSKEDYQLLQKIKAQLNL